MPKIQHKDPMTGRIEIYIHSDKSTPNKGAAMVKVTSQTDFAAKTDEFQAFAKATAVKAFAAKAESWADVVEMFPDIETDRVELEKTLREKISVDEISILVL
jgi:translation elongation factor EF-Ts